MSINEKDKINYKNNFADIDKRVIKLSSSKKHFEQFPFPIFKNLLLSKAISKAKDDSLNEHSHSHKKIMTSINDIHEKNSFNNTITTKRKLIEENESKNKIKNISSSQLKVGKEQNNLTFYAKKTGIITAIDDHCINFSKYVFPFNSLENQKSNNNSLNIFPININNRIIKSSLKERSYKNDDIYSNDHLLNNKCKYLYLNFNSNEKLAKKNKKYKNKSLDTDIFIKAINSLLMPDDKTFDSLEKMINCRIINKESLKNIDDIYFVNHNKNMNQNKIVQIIFKDIINKVIKQMVKRGCNNNSLISKNEIKSEYYNLINNLKEYLNSAKKFHNKNFLKKCQMKSSRNINNSSKVNFKNDKINNNFKKIKEIFTPKILNYNHINKKETINKSISNDNILFHYYNFDDIFLEIKKQKLRKGNLNKNMNIKFIKKPYFNDNFIKKINFQNSSIRNFKENGKNTTNEKSQNNSKENDFNKMINISNDSKKNSAMISVINLNSNQILLPEQRQIKSYNTKNNKNYSSNHVYYLDNIYAFKPNNKLEISSKSKNEITKEKNKNLSSINLLSKKSEYINNSDYKNKNMNLTKNKLKLKTIKNSSEEKNEEKLITNKNNNNNNNNIFHQKKEKNFHKNEDIINLIKSKKSTKNLNKQEEIEKNENNIIKISNNSIENDSSGNDSINKVNNINNDNNYKIKCKTNKKNDSKSKLNKEEYSSKNSIFNLDDINTIKMNIQNDINNNIESRNKMFKRNNSLNLEQNSKLKKRDMVRYNSFSYFAKKKMNLLIIKEPKILKVFNGKLNYKNINKDLKIYIAKNMNIIKNNSPVRRHKSIAQSYFQLFYKKNFVNEGNNNERDFFWKKKNFNKKKKSKERTFKDFLKYNKIEEKDNGTSSITIHEEIDDDKENDWEERFNQFKKYIKKLKNMTNEEFINDTMKFIKK